VRVYGYVYSGTYLCSLELSSTGSLHQTEHLCFATAFDVQDHLPALLRTCRIIHTEATQRLYSRTEFRLSIEGRKIGTTPPFRRSDVPRHLPLTTIRHIKALKQLGIGVDELQAVADSVVLLASTLGADHALRVEMLMFMAPDVQECAPTPRTLREDHSGDAVVAALSMLNFKDGTKAWDYGWVRRFTDKTKIPGPAVARRL
jgi:hypothetical protein